MGMACCTQGLPLLITTWAILNTQAIWAQAHSQPISTTVSHPVTSMTNVIEVATTLQPPCSPSSSPSLITQGPSGRPMATPAQPNMAKNAVKHVENSEKHQFGVLSKTGSIRPHPAIKDDWEWLKNNPPDAPQPLVRIESHAKRIIWW